MEYRLIVHHRDFLKSIKIDSVDKIKNSWVYGDGKYVLFSIEIDGERRRYETLFTDTKTIGSLNDKELLIMHNKLKRARLAILTILGVCVILGLLGRNN